jgi:hypothetical protein
MLSGDALKRIAAAVQSYEHGDRKTSPIKFRIPVGDDDVVRLGKVSETWDKGDTATVQQYTGSGEEIEDAEFEAVNRFATVTVEAESSVWVACVLIDSTWHLVAAECS